MDINRAYEEAKSLPDEALHHELNTPSGMLPGYIVLSELNERNALRGSASPEAPKGTIAQEFMARGYSAGGMIAGINPFNAYVTGLKSYKSLDKTPPPQNQSGLPGLPSLPAAFVPPTQSSLVPLAAGELPNLNNGNNGLPSLQQGNNLVGTAAALAGSAVPYAYQYWLDNQDTLPGGTYARGGVVSLTERQRALLDAIKKRESAGQYNVMYGGSYFSDYSHHPGVGHRILSGPNKGKTSSAAGAYQMLGSTWQEQKKKLGLKDFSPANQDQAAWDLAKTRYHAQTGGNLDDVLAQGTPEAIQQVTSALHPTWTSLPGGIEQGATSREFYQTYRNALGQPVQIPQTVQPAQMNQAVAQQATQQAAQQAASQAAINAQAVEMAGATQAAQAAQAAQATQAAQASQLAPADPFGGLMSLMLMASSSQPSPPPAMGGAAPRKFTRQADPDELTAATSQTPDVYRRRRMRYA